MATLYWSPNSPYVKKVILGLRELGLEDTVTIKRGVTGPTLKETEHDAWNPSGKVPTLVFKNGRPLFGSQVILQYLSSLDSDQLLGPSDTKFDELTLESLADTVLDAALLVRYEISGRPEELQWSEWIEGQESKMKRGLKLIYKRLDPNSGFHQLPDPTAPILTVGGIAVAAVCYYLDFRFPDLDWKSGEGAALADWYEKVKKRPSWSDGSN